MFPDISIFLEFLLVEGIKEAFLLSKWKRFYTAFQ